MAVRLRGAGFTMLELSIVLVVIALVTSIGIASSVGVLESSRRTATENKLSEIETALMNFRTSKNRLPCPGDPTLLNSSPNYGLEAANAGLCYGGTPSVPVTTRAAAGNLIFGNIAAANSTAYIVEGAVPVKTLNLPDEYMYDGWGHKFAYAIDVGATDPDAFSTIMPNETCGIQIKDASNTVRSTRGGIYTLVSFGVDGYGGYLPGGTRSLGGGSISNEEKQNCHCDGVVPYDGIYVQKDSMGDAAAGVGVFDDIVRFKERWQLESLDNYSNFSGYNGAHLIAGYNTSDGGARLYRHECGTWKMQTDLTGSGKTFALAITPDNQHMVIYSATGFILYDINADGTYANAGVIPPAGGGSVYYNSANPAALAISNNNYMGMVVGGAPYLYLWKQTGALFTALPLPTSLLIPGSAPGTVNPAVPTMITFSKDAQYLALADAANHLIVYQRSGDTFVQLAISPSSKQPLEISTIRAIAFSPDGKYLAAAISTPSPAIDVWAIADSDTPFASKLTPLTAPSLTNPIAAMAFSPDSKYLAVGGGAAGGVNNDNITIYKVDAGDVFTKLSLPTGWVNDVAAAGTAIAFSPDSRYLAMASVATTYQPHLFRRVSPTEFKYIVDVHPYGGVTSPGLSVGFTH